MHLDKIKQTIYLLIDYGDERNYIIENAVPKLQLFCRRKGLDFQVDLIMNNIRTTY